MANNYQFDRFIGNVNTEQVKVYCEYIYCARKTIIN